MQKKYIILPIILTLFSLLSAGAPDTLWTRTYGGNLQDMGYSVQQTSDGGFIITGLTNYDSLRSGDVYLIRTDSNGDTLWTKTFSGTKGEMGHSVQQTTDGGFIIAGETFSYGAGGTDVYLIRTNLSGDTLWTKTYGGTEWDMGYSVDQTSRDGFIIAGQTCSFGDLSGDVYLICTNSDGDTLWTKTYGGELRDGAYSIQETTDSGFIITGYTESIDAGDSNVYLMRTDENGDTLWTKTYGGEYRDWGNSVQQTSDGGFIITGESWFLSSLLDFYLIRTDSEGDTLWTRAYGGISYDHSNSVQQTNDGGFIIVGETQIPYDTDVYIIRTNSNGDTLWTKTYGGTKGDAAFSVRQTIDGGFIIVGGTRSFNDTLGDVYLIRLDKDTTGIDEEIPSNLIKSNDFIVSYNHGKISIRYTIPYSTPAKLEAYDIKGKLVKIITDKFMNKGSYGVNWDSRRFGSGVYYIKLSTGNNTLIQKAIVIK